MNGTSRRDSEHMVERNGRSWGPMTKASKRKLQGKATSLRQKRNKETYEKERINPKPAICMSNKVRTRVRAGIARCRARRAGTGLTDSGVARFCGVGQMLVTSAAA